MAAVLQRFQGLFSPAIKPSRHLLACRNGSSRVVQRLTQLENGGAGLCIKSMEKNHSVAKIALMKRPGFLTPRPPVGAPRFPVAEASTTVLPRRGIHWNRRGLGGLPSIVGLLEHVFAFRRPFGCGFRVPPFRTNGRCSGIVRKQNISVHAELTVNLRF